MTLNFEAGISAQCATLKEYMREEAIPNLFRDKHVPKKHVAADMDISPSELTRKLSDNPEDPRNFTIDDLEKYLATQKDLSPIYYLLDKYGTDKQGEIAELEARLNRLKSEQGRAR
jgi:hypothetical protein